MGLYLGETIHLIGNKKFIKKYRYSEWADSVDEDGEIPQHIVDRDINLQHLKSMLPYYQNIEKTDNQGNSVLHILANHKVGTCQEYAKQRTDMLKSLISKGADVNRQNENAWTPIHYAAAHCNIDILKIMKKNANFNLRTMADETPLILACKSETKNILEEKKTIDFLVNCVRDVNSTDDTDYSALHYAAKNCTDKSVIKLLKSGADVHLRSERHKLTPLHFAAMKEDNLPIVQVLIEAGAIVESPEIEALTPLHISLLNSSSSVVEYLIGKGADVNHPDRILQFTPLHLTIYQQRFDLFQLLIDKGADVNGVGIEGLTPLHLSSMLGCSQFTEALISLGAAVNCSYNGLTPLHIASLMNHLPDNDKLVGADAFKHSKENNLIAKFLTYPHCQNSQEYETVIRLLLHNGADVNALTTSGWSSLHFAAKCGQHTVDFVKILLECGANVNHRESDSGFTALHLAAWNNLGTIVDVLIKAGADVNAKTQDGKSPLHLALETHSTKFADNGRPKVLIKNGGNFHCKDPQLQLTPLHVTILKSNENAASILINAGADVNALTSEGKSPIHLALGTSFKDYFVKMKETLILLIKHGADVNYTEPCSKLTPLHVALINKYGDAAEILINAGAEINALTPDGKRPIHLASISNCIGALKLILINAADVDCEEIYSELTPLHIALYENNQDAAIVLTKAGADVNASTPDGKSPLHLALMSNGTRILRNMLKCGAKLNCGSKRCLYTFLYRNAYLNDEDLIDELQEFGGVPLSLAIDGINNKGVEKAFVLLRLIVDAFDKNGCIPVDSRFGRIYAEKFHFLRKEYGVKMSDLDAYWRLTVDQVLSGRFHEFNDSGVNTEVSTENVANYLCMLKAAHLPLSDNYKNVKLRMPEYFASHEYQIYIDKCMDEAVRLHTYHVADGVTLYDILHMRSSDRRLYLENLGSSKIRQKFKIYHKLVLSRYREDKIKRVLMGTVQLAVFRLTSLLMPIPCIEKIFFDLNIMNIIATIDAAEMVN